MSVGRKRKGCYVTEPIHTTRSAAEYLQQRYGVEVKPETVKQWCNRKRLAGAYRIGDGRRSVWQIPQIALDELMKIRSIDPATVEAARGTPRTPGPKKGA